MATYKGIKGTAVQNYAGDLSGAADGQIWYDSTATDFKYQYEAAVGAWATGNAMNTSRNVLAGTGTQTSAIGVGGEGPPVLTNAETYNGTNWTEVNDIAMARKGLGGAGVSSTSALVFGGDGPPTTGNTESYSGTNWTEVNNLNTARQEMGACGTQTAALAFGGLPSGITAETETWNGTNWTEVNDLNTARNALGAAGIQSAALGFGGEGPPTLTASEAWNTDTTVTFTDS